MTRSNKRFLLFVALLLSIFDYGQASDQRSDLLPDAIDRHVNLSRTSTSDIDMVGTGACCTGMACDDALTQVNCENQGGIWFPGENCTLNAINDCNANGVVDICESLDDCNNNGTPDECELDPNCSQNFALDCNFDGVLNECDPDCQSNGTSDVCDLVNESVGDCGGGGPDVGSMFFGQLIHNANCAVCHGFGGFGNTAPNHRGRSRYTYQWKTSGCVFHTGGTFDLTPDNYADLQAYLSDLGGGGNGIPDECEGLADCDNDGVADECELAADIEADCDGNGIPDNCDISSGVAADCNSNGIPDACEGLPDCNNNTIPDECESLPDCNGDGVFDECDPDCNTNGQSDVCEVLGGATDCDGNLVPDECQPDCNANGQADACDIANLQSPDINANGIPDECEPDCNTNQIPDDLDLIPGDQGKSVTLDLGQPGVTVPDCDANGSTFIEQTIPVDFTGQCGQVEHLAVSIQLSHSWVGDLVAVLISPNGTEVTLFSRIGLAELDPFCGGGQCCGLNDSSLDVELDDRFPISIEDADSGTGQFHTDAGATAWPGTLSTFTGENECGNWTIRLYDSSEFDEGTLDSITLDFFSFQVSEDCNGNGVPDDCDLNSGTSNDCNTNAIPDDCEDCNGNSLADSCDIADGTSPDCNSNAIPDECEGFRDCNSNGVLDACDITSGFDTDCQGDGVPDQCNLNGTSGLFVTGFNSGNVVQYGAVTNAFLGEYVPSNGGGLNNPTGLVFSPTGDLLVSDFTSQSILRFDGDTGAAISDFTGTIVPRIVDLLIGPDDDLYALNSTGQITTFDGVTGTPIQVFADINPPTPPFTLSMAFNATGNLFVADFTNGAIIQIDGTTGNVIGSFTSGGTLINPAGLTFGPDGDLYISDTGANNIQVYNGTTGVFDRILLADLGGAGAFFFTPLEFGPDGHLYLGHSLISSVVELDSVTGVVLEIFPSSPLFVSTFDLTFRPASKDCNTNQIPDECEDCNNNRIADSCDITAGTSLDVNGNGIPDECEGVDVELAIVVRNQASLSDASMTPPVSDTIFPLGDPFVFEIWATDSGVVNSGLAEVYVNVTFDAITFQASNIDHRPPFTSNIDGQIDNVAGIISNLGGADLTASGVGISPEWRRVAIVELKSQDCPVNTTISVDVGSSGVSTIDNGLIDPADVSIDSETFGIQSNCVYDLDGDTFINAGDSGIFAGCWLTGLGDVGFNRACDFDCSAFVDAGDIGWFAAGWLQACPSISQSELPLCRRCDTGAPMIGDGSTRHQVATFTKPEHHNGLDKLINSSLATSAWRISWETDKSFIAVDETFEVSLYVRDETIGTLGVSAVFVDVVFDPNQVDVIQATTDDHFPMFASGTLRARSVQWFGGATLESGIGVNDRASFGSILLKAKKDMLVGPGTFTIIPREHGIAGVGKGLIDPADISLSPPHLYHKRPERLDR